MIKLWYQFLCIKHKENSHESTALSNSTSYKFFQRRQVNAMWWKPLSHRYVYLLSEGETWSKILQASLHEQFDWSEIFVLLRQTHQRPESKDLPHHSVRWLMVGEYEGKHSISYIGMPALNQRRYNSSVPPSGECESRGQHRSLLMSDLHQHSQKKLFWIPAEVVPSIHDIVFLSSIQ